MELTHAADFLRRFDYVFLPRAQPVPQVEKLKNTESGNSCTYPILILSRLCWGRVIKKRETITVTCIILYLRHLYYIYYLCHLYYIY